MLFKPHKPVAPSGVNLYKDGLNEGGLMAGTMSFEASRNEMLAAIRKNARRTETKVIRFENNGVPRFLERLEAFERKSRKSTFMVG